MSTARAETARPELARAALVELCRGLLDQVDVLQGCRAIEPDEMPEPFGDLLVHHDHMTTRLGDYYARPVELEVLKSEMSGEAYQRLIVLRPRGQDRVVEVGLVRIDLGCTTPLVRDMIVEGKRPLGEI